MKTPKVLMLIGEESRRNGTNTLTSRQIDQVIKAYRKEKRKRLESKTPNPPPRAHP